MNSIDLQKALNNLKIKADWVGIRQKKHIRSLLIVQNFLIILILNL